MVNVVDRYFALYEAYLSSAVEIASPEDVAAATRHATHGALKLADAIALHERLADARPRRIVEIGSFLGFSTHWILEASQPWDAQVISVDPGLRHRMFDQPRQHLRRFCAAFEARLTLIDACLAVKEEGMFMYDYLAYPPRLPLRDALTRIEAVPVLDEPFGRFDFAFIDGDHSFEATVTNVRLIARMMPAGGTIVVHDAISWSDVAPALRSVCDEEPQLTFTGIDGLSFHYGMDRLGGINGFDPGPLKASCSDGLGIIVVQPSEQESLDFAGEPATFPVAEESL